MVLVKRPYFKEDREIEAEYDAHKLSRAMTQRFLARPSLVRTHVTPSQFENLCMEVKRIKNTLRVHENMLSDLEGQIQTIQESQGNDEEVTTRIEAVSIENTKHLRSLFKLPTIVGDINEDVLANMKGMLKGKGREKIDSIELLHMIRGE